MDRILLRDILVRCIIGVNHDERDQKQDVLINLVLWADLRRAGETDALEDTVDYSAIKARVVEMVEASQFQLLESLAERIAGLCLEHPRVQQVEVTVDKPGALRFVRSVAVQVTRARE